MKHTFEFTLDELRIILAGLAEVPLKNSYYLFGRLQVEVDKIASGAVSVATEECAESCETKKSRSKNQV